MATLISPPCMVCNKTSQVEVTREALQMYENGAFVQDVWPHWTPDERELVMTGTHPPCWDEMFSDEEKK